MEEETLTVEENFAKKNLVKILVAVFSGSFLRLYLIFLDPPLVCRLRKNWIALKILAQKWNQFQLTQHLFINLKEMFCSQKFWLLFTLQGDLVSGLLRAGLIESELELQDLTTLFIGCLLVAPNLCYCYTLCAQSLEAWYWNSSTDPVKMALMLSWSPDWQWKTL